MYFYQRIRDLREDCDLSQQQIADFLQITRQQYQLYESGKREMPFHLFIRLAEYYNVSLDYIAGIISKKLPLKNRHEHSSWRCVKHSDTKCSEND